MKNYLIFLENSNQIGLTAKDNREAIKLALTFDEFKALKDDKGNIKLLNMGCRR